ncbi:MAG: GIY-YIG nuclease family protein [Spiroplasma sp.]|nr:GIY-YIG nuclease family protein [Spiroplasma sp.]
MSDIKEKKEIYLEEVAYYKDSQHLEFNLIQKTTKPKITRYEQHNYERYPIYGDVSVRTKVLKKFSRKIIPERFVEIEIKDLKLSKNIILELIDLIGITPEWRKKEIKLQAISDEINFYKAKLRYFEKEKINYIYKNTNYQDWQSNFWVRLLFAIPTLFLSFVGYVSKEKARLNAILNKENEKYNTNHKNTVDNKNQILNNEINKENKVTSEKIDKLLVYYQNVENQEIVLIKNDDKGWLDVRQASLFNFKDVYNKKGVYIIWNKDNNKYYIGQSKNLGLRLKQHFKNGIVNNVIFAKDWYNNHNFVYRYEICESKDELDRKEKQLIEQYNSFEHGYNKTSGNI